MEQIVNGVLEAMEKAGLVQVEVSARHVHLSQRDLETLFGPKAALTPKRELSQPGQYLSEERVTLAGPKGKLERTAVLGPVRPETQIELSRTDCTKLGIKAPIRESGDVAGSGSITLEGPCGSVTLTQGAIVAKNHVHLTPRTAERLNLNDKQRVSVRMFSQRPVIFQEVVIRVSENFRDRMHIDFDEANAAAVEGLTLGQIIP